MNHVIRQKISPLFTHSTTLLAYILTLAALGWFMSQTTQKMGYNWQWYRLWPALYSIQSGNFIPGPLLNGLLVTIKISALSLLLTIFIGQVVALARISRSVIASRLAWIYLEAVRNTPLLIQIFFVYFVLGPIFNINAFIAAVTAISLFEGAYASEIFRAGILSVGQGQHDAAASLGLTTWQQYRYVILPQAVRAVIPPLTGQCVSLVKDSALVSVIAISDLTMQGQSFIADTFLSFEVWFTVAGLYLIVNLLLTALAKTLEKKYTPPRIS